MAQQGSEGARERGRGSEGDGGGGFREKARSITGTGKPENHGTESVIDYHRPLRLFVGRWRRSRESVAQMDKDKAASIFREDNGPDGTRVLDSSFIHERKRQMAHG